METRLQAALPDSWVEFVGCDAAGLEGLAHLPQRTTAVDIGNRRG
jgi:hypothetical protein